MHSLVYSRGHVVNKYPSLSLSPCTHLSTSVYHIESCATTQTPGKRHSIQGADMTAGVRAGVTVRYGSSRILNNYTSCQIAVGTVLRTLRCKCNPLPSTRPLVNSPRTSPAQLIPAADASSLPSAFQRFHACRLRTLEPCKVHQFFFRKGCVVCCAGWLVTDYYCHSTQSSLATIQ